MVFPIVKQEPGPAVPGPLALAPAIPQLAQLQTQVVQLQLAILAAPPPVPTCDHKNLPYHTNCPIHNCHKQKIRFNGFSYLMTPNTTTQEQAITRAHMACETISMQIRGIKVAIGKPLPSRQITIAETNTIRAEALFLPVLDWGFNAPLTLVNICYSCRRIHQPGASCFAPEHIQLVQGKSTIHRPGVHQFYIAN